MALTLAMLIQALSRSRFPIVLTTSMALGIGAGGLITLGRQAIGDGVITTDIGTTVTTGFITDGTKARNGTFSGMARARPFGRLWYDTPDNAIGYAIHSSRSHHCCDRRLRCGLQCSRDARAQGRFQRTMNSYSHFFVRFFLFAHPESAFNN